MKSEEAATEKKSGAPQLSARERLSAAKAAREERERAREDEEAELRALRELEELQALEKAEEEHGHKRVALVPTALGGVVIKAPHEALVRRFQDAEGTSTDDLDKLIGPSIVFPARDDFEKMLREKPGIRVDVSREVLRLAGYKLKELAGKS